MGILGMTLSLFFLQPKNPSQDLENDKRAMTSVLELARSYAQSGYGVEKWGEKGLAWEPTGYGVYVEKGGSQEYVLYIGNGDYKYNAEKVVEVGKYYLNKSVINDCGSGNGCDIFFSFYEGTSYMEGYPGFSAYMITLQSVTSPSIIKTITINGTTAQIQ